MPGGTIYTESFYEIMIVVSDPNNDLHQFNFSITGGNLKNQSANVILWETPADPGVYTVTATVTDKEGNVTVANKDFTVESKWQEVK
jgi:PKD repeat protein